MKWVLCLLFLSSCGLFMPKNIDQAVRNIERRWPQSAKDSFRNLPENKAIYGQYAEGTGLWMRNHWLRGLRDPALVFQFYGLGVNNFDDMSVILLRSIYRDLNHRPLAIDSQAAESRKREEVFLREMALSEQKAMLKYNSYNTGDTIQIIMPVDTFDKQRNAVGYGSYDSLFEFNPANDLLIKGIITKKYRIDGSRNVYWSVVILTMNFPDTQIMGQAVKPLDTNFDLENLNVLPWRKTK